MATLRGEPKLAAVSRETQEYPRNSQSQNLSAPGLTEEHTAQVPEAIEEELLRNLGALSKLNEYLLNPTVFTFSRTIPGTFRNADIKTRNQAVIIPRMIPILKWSFLLVMPAT